MGRVYRWAKFSALIAIGGATACATPKNARMAGEVGSGPPATRAPAHRDVESLLRKQETGDGWPSGLETLDLAEFLGEVERRNASLEAKRRAWHASRMRAPQAESLDDPEFSFMFGPRTIDGIGSGGSGMDFGFAYKPEISQRFPFPGKLRLRGDAARHEAEGEYAELREVRDRLLNEAKDAYYERFWVHRAQAINAKAVGIFDEMIANALARYEAGTASKQDALQAEVERERLRHRDIMLHRMERIALARLNTLLNRAPESDLPPPPPDLPVGGIPMEREALRHRALGQRPELQALAARFDAAEARVALARREFYPDFMLTAAYDAFWQEDELRPMLGFGLNIPIQQRRRRAALAEAEESAASVRFELEEQAARIAYEVEASLQRLMEALHGDEVYRERIIPAARESLESALAGYAAGELELAAVLLSQKALLDLELESIELQVNARRSFADLERAVGGPLGDGEPVEEEAGS
jgi:outer membrane protein, heavy metal efflux system